MRGGTQEAVKPLTSWLSMEVGTVLSSFRAEAGVAQLTMTRARRAAARFMLL
jgi:hypothetical protein